jgi:hypothetical protein
MPKAISDSFITNEPGKSPVFILGCGRSGTTILGTALSKHQKVVYLNEPRDLWVLAYPETDIWSSQAFERKGKIILTESDEREEKSRKLREVFYLETVKSNKPVLIEKTPINNFRLHLINAIFPNARFIYIYRNGLEVASSIERRCYSSPWFGSNQYKWKQLTQIAMSSVDTEKLPALCTDFYDMGLLEWRLSTEAALNFLKRLPKERFFELTYNDLVDNPIATITKIVSFIGIPPDPDVLAFASENIRRKTNEIIYNSITEKEKIIGGEFLNYTKNDCTTY